ncbi:MAG: serine protease [Chloroflexota bacterium]|nr:serine protease [Chloroflexota bacterium]
MKRPALLPLLLASLAILLPLAAACQGEEKAPSTASPSASPLSTTTASPTRAATSVEDLARAVVQVVALRETADGYEELWRGSGTIIDKSGLILTNYHVVEEEVETESGEIIRRDELGVALTTTADQAPEPSYFARVLAQDPLLDLAVIQPYADNEGNEIDPNTLNLPTIPLGDATTLVLGQELTILGYPTIGGESITFTAGRVSGFLSQEGVEERRAWIKTDAGASPGNSGGAALDAQGRLVGVPTRATIDVGGSINRVRPVDLATDVIDRAQAGGFVATGQRQRPAATPEVGQVFITGLVFARDVTPDGELIDIVNEFPAATTKLVFSFDYAGMKDGYDWVDKWYIDGVLDEELSAPREPWTLGESGAAWVSLEPKQPLLTGKYRLVLEAQGQQVAEATTYVGRTAVGPSVGPITFAQDVSADDTPIGPTSSFPEGPTNLYTFFDYDDAATVAEYDWLWVWKSPVSADQDRVYESDRYAWEGGDSGNWWVGLEMDDPLPGGTYEFQLYFDDELAQTGTFTVQGPAGVPDWPSAR